MELADPDTSLCFVLEPTDRAGGREIADETADGPGEADAARDTASKPSETGDVVKRANDRIYTHIIEPAIEGRGFRIVRSSGISSTGNMTREHESLIDSAGLVIANLTGADPIVYYCLARRLALRGDLFVIALLEKGRENLFEIPVPFAAPIQYGADPALRKDTVESLISLENDSVITARTDLTRAVRRAQLELDRLAKEPKEGRPGDQKGSTDAEASATGDKPRNHHTDAAALSREFLSDVVREEIRRATQTGDLRALRDHFLSRR